MDQAVRQVPVKMPAVGMVAVKARTVPKLESGRNTGGKNGLERKGGVGQRRDKYGFRRIMGKMAI